MREFLITLFSILLLSCSNDEEFFADTKYFYVPEWKIWKIETHTKNILTGEITISQSRNIDTRYIFTDSFTYRSTTQGALYNKLITRHLSLDSISFSDPQSGDLESYKVLEMFRMNDAIPPNDSTRTKRDLAFAELHGFFLFLHLENKEKRKGENEEITEFFLLYN